MNPRYLFDVALTTHQQCQIPGCGAIRTAGQEGPLITCGHDRWMDDGTHDLGRGRPHRPAGCLNRATPEHAPFPDGF